MVRIYSVPVSLVPWPLLFCLTFVEAPQAMEVSIRGEVRGDKIHFSASMTFGKER